MPDQQESERLRRLQALRAEEEAKMADEAPEEDERAMHERRSDKASYLKEKLEEQVESQDED
jgi:hypothetical protein